MATQTRIGYGQVERQHMAAPHNGQIYAQLPALNADGTPIAQLENGQFLKYDYANGKAGIGTSGDGKEWFLVYNEEKLYDERYQNHRHFAMKAADMSDRVIYPRLLRTFVGDIFTTNTFKSTDNTPKTVSGGDDEITIPDLNIGDYVVIGNDGWLVKGTGTGTNGVNPPSGTDIVFQVIPHFTQMNLPTGATVPAYTLPDGQWAVKLQRIR